MTCPLHNAAANNTAIDRDGSGSDPVRLLVVEDEAIVALYLSDMLEELNYNVCGVAASGAAALDIAARERPALALVDIALTGKLDGIETARTLRERYAVASLVMSGAGDSETLERAKTAGCQGFLQKPYTTDQLKAALERILGTG
ncbi:MAG TPA: response regulator [Azospirillum sp.]|nr:response regulator [Azospirillum sp.]